MESKWIVLDLKEANERLKELQAAAAAKRAAAGGGAPGGPLRARIHELHKSNIDPPLLSQATAADGAAVAGGGGGNAPAGDRASWQVVNAMRQAEAIRQRDQSQRSQVIGTHDPDAAAYWYRLADDARQALAARNAPADSDGPAAIAPAGDLRANNTPTAVAIAPAAIAPAANDPTAVRLYPELGIAARRADESTCYRLWLSLHYLAARPGRSGTLHLADIKSEASTVAGMSWARIRQLLNKGEGRYWDRDNHGRLFLRGAARLGAALAVDRLDRPYNLPVASLAKHKDFNAAILASKIINRNPASQANIAARLGIPDRTQRDYCQYAGITRQVNIAIGERADTVEGQERAYKQGRASFIFRDARGRQGRPGGKYIAWRLPNTYTSSIERANTGRLKKDNQRLKDLVSNGERGNGRSQVVKIFFPNVEKAHKKFNRNPNSDTYYPRGKAGYNNLWGVIQGNQ
jgi:hypothetical protein